MKTTHFCEEIVESVELVELESKSFVAIVKFCGGVVKFKVCARLEFDAKFWSVRRDPFKKIWKLFQAQTTQHYHHRQNSLRAIDFQPSRLSSCC